MDAKRKEDFPLSEFTFRVKTIENAGPSSGERYALRAFQGGKVAGEIQLLITGKGNEEVLRADFVEPVKKELLFPLFKNAVDYARGHGIPRVYFPDYTLERKRLLRECELLGKFRRDEKGCIEPKTVNWKGNGRSTPISPKELDLFDRFEPDRPWSVEKAERIRNGFQLKGKAGKLARGIKARFQRKKATRNRF